jgi:hypothetical protein
MRGSLVRRRIQQLMNKTGHR